MMDVSARAVCAIFGAMARLGVAQCIEVDGRRMQVVFDNDCSSAAATGRA